MRMANKQRGMTGIGWLTVLGLIAFFSLLALRMIPSYLEYYKVASALEKLTGESGLADVNPTSIRRHLERQFDIGYVSVVKPRDISVKPYGEFYKVRAKYDDRVHLFGNVAVVMSFDKTVKVPRT
jgi:hypothetical protein